jgi:hypothetical protein
MMPKTKLKTKYELEIENVYKSILQYMKTILGNDTTFSTDLQKVGDKLFGSKFKGVFASDKLPKLDSLKKYAIINLDNSSKPGSHWIGIAYDNNDDTLMVYDSFGRKSQKIIPSLRQTYSSIIKDTDYDSEQRIRQNDCGQRALSWLYVYDKLGPNKAVYI